MSERRELVVGMDYPGKVISVNHCYAPGPGGRRFLRKEARAWRAKLAESLGYLLLAEGLRGAALDRAITVRIDCAYTNEHEATDPDNLRKLTNDAVEEATGVNDRHYQPERGEVRYGAAIPAIVVTVGVRTKRSEE